MRETSSAPRYTALVRMMTRIAAISSENNARHCALKRRSRYSGVVTIRVRQ